MKKIIIGLVILGLVFGFKLALADDSQTSLLVLRRGNGAGTITSGTSVSQDTRINCGSTCQANFNLNETINLTAVPRSDSVFKGWLGCDITDSDKCTVTMSQSRIVNPVFELIDINSQPVPTVDPADLKVARVMFWWGKVNQHWNLDTGVWETDADGLSGAREDKLAYCKKFYPTTVKVIEYKNETINTWHDAYNQGQYISTKMSYRCVLANETVEGEDVSTRPEKPNAGSICYYFPNLDYCRPFNGPNPGVNPPALNTSNQPTVTPTNVKSAVPTETKPAEYVNPEKVDLLSSNKINQLLEEMNQLRNKLKEQENEILYLKNLQAGVKPVSAAAKTSINNFITYGVDENTRDLGMKERAAAVASYKTAFNKLPETKTELAAAVQIANGEAPTQVNVKTENKAKVEFKKIYNHNVDLKNPEEAGAIKIISYGLKVANNVRNLEAEKTALKDFVKIYKRTPKTDWDWNIIRALAYSGAKK